MSEYGYKDVIIDPNDERVSVGDEYWFSDYPNEVIKIANSNGPIRMLKDIDYDNSYPFTIGSEHYQCLIKVPEDSYVPFDLDNEEERVLLRGAWVRNMEQDAVMLECIIISIFKNEAGEWTLELPGAYVTPEVLLKEYTFLDGTPCGRKRK